jgi:hypothetical protein
MPEVVIHCQVPVTLREPDMLPYIRRKLRGASGVDLADATHLQWAPSIRNGFWGVSFRCRSEHLPSLERFDLVRSVEWYRPPPPPMPTSGENDDDSGMASGGGLYHPWIERGMLALGTVLYWGYLFQRFFRSKYVRYFG